MRSKELKGKFLLDSDVFILYIKGNELADHSEKIVKSLLAGALEAYVSSILYDDVISGLRSKSMELGAVIESSHSHRIYTHKSLAITPSIAISALTTYMPHHGPRKLHYFDAFHVATARLNELPMITNDRYINEQQTSLGITAFDLRTL